MGIFSKDLKDIGEFQFPAVVIERTKQELGKSDITIVQIALLDFLVASVDNSLEMTNKDVDVLWHNFILHTQSYAEFCEDYLGKFIHHTPHVEMKPVSDTAMRGQQNMIEKSVKSNTRYYSYRTSTLDNYRNDDDLMVYLMWYTAMSECSAEAQSACRAETADTDSELREELSSCGSYTPAPEPEHSTPSVSSCSSASSCSSGSSSSCSSGSSSCGSSCSS